MKKILINLLIVLIITSIASAVGIVDDFESYTDNNGDKPLSWYWTANGDDVTGTKVSISTSDVYMGEQSLMLEWNGTVDGEWDTVAAAAIGLPGDIVFPISAPGVTGVRFAFKGDIENDPGGFLQLTLFGVDDWYYPIYDDQGQLIPITNPNWQLVYLDLGHQLSGCWGVQFEMAGLAKNDPSNGGVGYFDNLETISVPQVCGDPATVYKITDINKDCYVNLVDLAEIAANWMTCTDPADELCDQYWKF